jgi:hypothetical protein
MAVSKKKLGPKRHKKQHLTRAVELDSARTIGFQRSPVQHPWTIIEGLPSNLDDGRNRYDVWGDQ